MNTDEPAKLIERIEKLLAEHDNVTKLRRALSLAAEAARTPASERRDELMRDARELLRRALGAEGRQ
jgi:proline dehydrogenase